jgi:hypothetical protein
MSDADAHEFYADPENLAADGPGQSRQRPMKTGMIPVRVAPEMIAAVKRFADQDGVTVSTWIRRLIGRELQRRQPPATAAVSVVRPVEFRYPAAIRPQSETTSGIDPGRLAAIC